MKPKLQQLIYRCFCGYVKEINIDYQHIYKEVKCPECGKVLKPEENNIVRSNTT